MTMPLHPSYTRYRPDIDGLRAIAVLAVVAFHAFPSWMKGGFIGVDIFFVISGYLISTIIFENLDRGDSFIEFYSRRIRRIFPALILVLVTCFTFGWFTLLVDEYEQLGKYIAAGAGFISNIVLWNDAGYFDNYSETKPLLHLWSLAIEEQFYVIWPVLLWMAWKCKFNPLIITLLVALISFALNAKGIKQDAIATFYSPQTRFWELLCGSLLAWLTLYRKAVYQSEKPNADVFIGTTIYSKKAENNHTMLANIMSAIGFILLAYGFGQITKELAFPGYWALIPVSGSVLIIASGSNTWLNRHILSNRLLVWFGLISFPLYLWHYPLLSFARILENTTPSTEFRISAVICAIFFSWVTYRFIECPLRFGRNNRIKTIALVIAMIAVGYLGYYVFKLNGVQSRKLAIETTTLEGYNYFNGKSEEEFWKGRCFNLKDGIKYFIDNNCDGQKPESSHKVFIIGDSHSAYLGQYLGGYLNAKDFGVYQYSTAHCIPLSTKDRRQRCRDINSYILKRVHDIKPDFLIIFGNYLSWEKSSDYGESVPYDEFIWLQVSKLKNLGAKNVLLVGQMPMWEDTLPHIIARRFISKHQKIPARTYDGINPQSLTWDSKLSSQSYPKDVRYLSIKDLLCDQEGCITIVGQNLSQDLIVFDKGHLTNSGAQFITERLIYPHLIKANPNKK